MGVFSNTYLSTVETQLNNIEQNTINTDLTFYDIYLSTLINTFKYKNLPTKNLPMFMVEQFLQYSGRIAVFDVHDYDNSLEHEIKIFPAFPSGALLENGEYSHYTAIALNGKTYQLEADKCVIIFNNCTKTPYAPLVQFFSEKSSHSLRAVDNALNKASIGTIIGVETAQQVKLVNELNDQSKTMKPFIAIMREKFGAKELERASIFDNKETDVLALWDVYVRYRNLFYSTFGVNNVEITKKERLTEAEGSGNDEIVRYSLLDDMYERRIEGFNKVNEKYGCSIEVEVNRDEQTVYEIITDNKKKLENYEILMTRGSNIANTSNDGGESENE